MSIPQHNTAQAIHVPTTHYSLPNPHTSANMPINWQDPEVKDRLLASIIASMGGTVNCTLVAHFYGPDATYNAIENFLRKPKAKAKELVAEADGRGDATPSKGTPRKKARDPVTPKKDGVKTGRVGKAGVTPKKSPAVKKEVLEEKKEVLEEKKKVLEEIFGEGEVVVDEI